MPKCKIGDMAIILPHPVLLECNPESVGIIVRIYERDLVSHPRKILDTTYWKVRTSIRALRVFNNAAKTSMMSASAAGVPDCVLEPIRPPADAVHKYMLNALDHALTDMLNRNK